MRIRAPYWGAVSVLVCLLATASLVSAATISVPAGGDLQKAIDSGGLNTVEIDQARYQSAQLYMQEEKWKEGAAALEEWFKSAANPNSAAYYLLAVAYYQQDDYAKALPPAKLMPVIFGPASSVAATLLVRVSMIEIVSSPLFAVMPYLPSWLM